MNKTLKGNRYKESTKNNNYSLVCGICGKKIKRSEAVRDAGSSSGYICEDCNFDLRLDHEIIEY